MGIDVDAQAIVRGESTEKKLMRLARSMSAWIDRHRPWKITPEESVDGLPRVCELSRRVIKRKRHRNRLSSQLKKIVRGSVTSPLASRTMGGRSVPKFVASPTRPTAIINGYATCCGTRSNAAELVSV